MSRSLQLQQRRVRRSIGLRALARQLGISAQYLLDMERGNRPMSRDMALAYTKALADLQAKPSAGLPEGV